MKRDGTPGKSPEKKTAGKREREKQVMELMIRLYCRKNHGEQRRKELYSSGSAVSSDLEQMGEDSTQRKNALCSECRALRDYAMLRIEKCPFMETKTFCSNCRVHCYKPEMREKIREVMRFSGPRMIFYHPVMAVHHVISSMQEKKRLEREERQ